MSLKSRSLVSNSVSSVASSGILLVTTILGPALLVRTITKQEYNLYLSALAILPLLSIIPQSLRTMAASELARAIEGGNAQAAVRSYLGFCLRVAGIVLVGSLVGAELYHALGRGFPGEDMMLRFGLYCVVANVIGIVLIGIVTGPAAAYHNFLPDNLAKIWPVLFQIVSVALIWLLRPAAPLWWLFATYALSTWTIAILLAARLWRVIYGRRPDGHGAESDPRIGRSLRAGLSGVVWWNLTSFLATTASLMIVAVAEPHDIAAFSVAVSLLGISSAGLIAVTSPIAVYASAIDRNASDRRRRFFLTMNTLFQVYIGLAACVVCLLPQWLFALWLTPQLAGEVRWISLLLLPSYVLRLLTMCFTVFVMSAGRQSTLWLSPLVEAVCSVVGCLVLGDFYGIPGIAAALTLSAAIRLVMTVAHDERVNVEALNLRAGDVLLSGWRLVRGR